jgi:hypothetical protein
VTSKKTRTLNQTPLDMGNSWVAKEQKQALIEAGPTANCSYGLRTLCIAVTVALRIDAGVASGLIALGADIKEKQALISDS